MSASQSRGRNHGTRPAGARGRAGPSQRLHRIPRNIEMLRSVSQITAAVGRGAECEVHALVQGAPQRAPQETGGLDARLADMCTLVDRSIATVQRIATRLRPRVLDDLGLASAPGVRGAHGHPLPAGRTTA